MMVTSFVSSVYCYWCPTSHSRWVLLFFHYSGWCEEGGKYCVSSWLIHFAPGDGRHWCCQFVPFPKSLFNFLYFFAFGWFQLVLVSAKHAMSMLNFCIALHVSSRGWYVLESSSPFTFWNRMRTESVVLVHRVW